MIKTLAAATLTASLACLGAAQAQVVVPPGQDFYATPIAHDMPTVAPVAKIAAAAPTPKAKKKVMKKHGMMKMHGMMKKKMMKKKTM